VLAWPLGEPTAESVRSLLASADLVLASDLTLIECDRVLTRAVSLGELVEAEAAARRATLNRAARHWTVFRIDGDVVARARRPFPVEPIRTLDAVHLSTALVTRELVPDLSLLCFDRRVRENARALGFPIHPGPVDDYQP
jgi:predicted nucleic acid-binding protein